MIFRQLFERNTSTYTYILADENSKEAVIIDPVAEMLERDITLIQEMGLQLLYTFETHVHADHITSSGLLHDLLGCKTVVRKETGVHCASVLTDHGQKSAFGAYELEVRSTPGHTDGCTTFVVRDGETTFAFTGDALLIRGCGRTDFQQGNAGVLYDSVHQQIFSLPPNTHIYPGHDYKGRTSSTVWEERLHNPRLKDGISKDKFIAIMNNLNLAYPKQIDQAVPANQKCGRENTHV